MKRSTTLVAAVLLAGSLSLGSQAATLHVANNGVDSASCGSKANPCRSINQAITTC